MILSINTVSRNKIEIGILKDGQLKCFDFDTKNQSGDLLLTIEGIFKKENLDLKDMQAVLVNLGPGSFTGIRIGVTVANTLGWSLNIPIFGYQDGKLDLAIKKLSTTKMTEFSKIVLPYYN